MMNSPAVQQFVNLWNRQTRAQKITLVVLTAAGIILSVVLIIWATTPTYTVAYRGLSESDAGQIVQKLKDNGTAYKLESGGTILVPSDALYETRLTLAKDGLPATSQVGFELFSGNTLGMTEFTQKINYQRALEGELERTIGSLDAVNSVRVHVVTPEKTLLTSDQNATTASITLKIKSGRNLSPDTVQAITYLVSSAVEGLKPENVVVVDTEGNMLTSSTAQKKESAYSSQSDVQQAAEKAAAADVQRKVQKFLDSVLGTNKSVVQTSVIMDWTQKETVSQTFNPTPAAVRSSQKINESYGGGAVPTAGVPGSGTNLPTVVPTSAAGSTSSAYNRSEEIFNYEISKTDIKQIDAPGRISRLSVSVLVDGITDANQLAILKSAVAAAAGINDARGDTVVVESLDFDRTVADAAALAETQASQMDLFLRIGAAVGVAILLILLLWYIQRLFRNLRLASSEVWTTVMKPVGEAAFEEPAMTPMIGSGYTPGPMTAAAMQQLSEIAPGGQLGAPSEETQIPMFELPKPQMRAMTAEEEQMQRVVQRLTEENPATVAEIVQLWLSEDEK